MNKILSVVGIGLILALTAAPARSQDLNLSKRTNLTFSAPVRLPGVTLQAGAYVFVHLPSMNTHIVQVLSQDGTKTFGIFLTIPNQRIELTDQPYVSFKEGPANAAVPIRAWFYPGERTGDEFVYSAAEAREISNATHEQVLTMPPAGEACGEAEEEGDR